MIKYLATRTLDSLIGAACLIALMEGLQWAIILNERKRK